MQRTDPVEIADIEKAADLNSEEMTAIKGGVSPLNQAMTATSNTNESDATSASGKVSNSGITVS